MKYREGNFLKLVKIHEEILPAKQESDQVQDSTGSFYVTSSGIFYENLLPPKEFYNLNSLSNLEVKAFAVSSNKIIVAAGTTKTADQDMQRNELMVINPNLSSPVAVVADLVFKPQSLDLKGNVVVVGTRGGLMAFVLTRWYQDPIFLGSSSAEHMYESIHIDGDKLVVVEINLADQSRHRITYQLHDLDDSQRWWLRP